MARSLTIHRTVVTPADRERWYDRIRARENHFKAAGCRYWVFEEQSLSGAFVEFCEANDTPTLRAAHAASPDPVLDPTRIYTIVELA